MSDHTKGEWYMHTSSQHADCDYSIYDTTGQDIAHVSCRPGAEAEANVRLMRSSPVLLAALEPLANMILHIQRRVGVYEAYALHVGADVAKQIVDAVSATRGVK